MRPLALLPALIALTMPLAAGSHSYNNEYSGHRLSITGTLRSL